MSQPRRRRRRRPKREQASDGHESPAGRHSRDTTAESRGSGQRARRRRGRRGRGSEGAAVPSQSEQRPAPKINKPLTAPPDGTTLEDVIRELQSTWGVPQSPQEFRITLKVADEGDVKGDRTSLEEPSGETGTGSLTDGSANGDRPQRERAPAAPRIAAGAPTDGAPRREKAGRSRRSRRRRRRGRGDQTGSSGA